MEARRDKAVDVQHISIHDNRAFLHNTCVMPNKLAMLLSNYRSAYSVDSCNTSRNKCKQKNDGAALSQASESHSPVDEMNRTIQLFRFSCSFIGKHLMRKPHSPNQSHHHHQQSKQQQQHLESERDYKRLFSLTKLRHRFKQIDRIRIEAYDHEAQLDVLKRCVELALCSRVNDMLLSKSEQTPSRASMLIGDQAAQVVANSTPPSINRYKVAEDGSIVEQESTTNEIASINSVMIIVNRLEALTALISNSMCYYFLLLLLLLLRFLFFYYFGINPFLNVFRRSSLRRD
jgi:hypothetical protein